MGSDEFLASLQNFAYEYDAVGNITRIMDYDEELKFSYDALSRLVSVSEAYAEEYRYNAETGNLEHKTGVGDYHYSTDKPHAVTGYGNQNNVFEYDGRGQMIKRYGQRIEYDARGNLISYNGNRHVYDGDDNRVMTEHADDSVSIYIGDYYERLIPRVDDFGPVIPPDISLMSMSTQNYSSYFPILCNGEGPNFETIPGQSYYYAGSGRIGTRTEKGEYIWIYGDHLGSTSVTANRYGEELSRRKYTAWGTTRHSTGEQATDYGYTGQMQVDDIYYYNARWYDPAIGRFMQADTIVPPHQGTQGFDRYAYVNNNPMRYTDPTGHIFREGILMMHDSGGGYSNEDPIDYIYNRMMNDFKKFREIKNILLDMVANNRFNAKSAYQALGFHHAFHIAKFIVGSRPGGQYDLKPSLTQRYFQGVEDKEKYVRAGDIEVKFDTFGNVYFGFVGSMLGMSEATLLQGAGAAQLIDDVRNKRELKIQSGKTFDSDGFSIFDQLEDQASISLGIQLWNTYGADLTKENFI